MDYLKFYDIAEYGNKMWNKGNFSHKEVAENAHIYCVDFEWSKENKELAHNIKELVKLLAEDGCEECRDWLYDMATEFKLHRMVFADFLEMEAKDIIAIFLRGGVV